jgi:hypothetical protein
LGKTGQNPDFVVNLASSRAGVFSRNAPVSSSSVIKLCSVEHFCCNNLSHGHLFFGAIS